MRLHEPHNIQTHFILTEADYLQLHDSFTDNVKTVITAHKSPDGDAVGSALGLYHYLKALGQEHVTVVLPDEIPGYLKWMPGAAHVLTYEAQPHDAETKIAEADYIFSLDYNSLSRIGALKKLVTSSEACIINIDHHQEPEDFADFVLLDSKASSTAELVYEFLDKLSFDEKLPLEAGQCLYVGIVTDTGSFKYRSTRAQTLEIAARLMRSGVKPGMIYDKTFDQNRLSKLKLTGFVLNEKLELWPDLNTAVITLTKEELDKYEYIKGDTEGLVNYGLSVENIVLAVFIKESNEGYFKMSFRSKGSVDVNEIARKHFEGGGHINAAGGKSTLPLEETLRKLKNILPLYEGKLHSAFL